jgi:hypothetical protein
MPKLPKFEGREVAASRITVPNIGGGLNDALDVQPIVIRHGQEGFGIFRWKCRDVDHVPFKKGDTMVLARHHVIPAESVMIVQEDADVDAVRVMLAAHEERVRRELESMEGQRSLEDEIPDNQLSEEELAIRKTLQGKPVKKA